MSHVQVTITGTVVVETELQFSLDDLGQACGAGADTIAALVHEGVLAPLGEGPAHWRFAGTELARARRATRLMHDLELGAPGVALVLELFEQIESLRSELRRRGG
jgi:chaperone modulatory protein CbpM